MNIKFRTIVAVLSLISLTCFSVKAENSYIKVNYGITSNSLGVSATKGSITTDEEDEGFMFSGGSMIGDFWGIDVMYYDLGDSKITVSVDDVITVDNANFAVDTGKSGDITQNTTGFGIGLITAGSSGDDFLSLDYYFKLGLHSWDKEGSTTLLIDNSGFASKFYNDGIGAYGGVGVSLNILTNTSLDLAYDAIGISNDASFSNNSTMASLGLRVKF